MWGRAQSEGSGFHEDGEWDVRNDGQGSRLLEARGGEGALGHFVYHFLLFCGFHIC